MNNYQCINYIEDAKCYNSNSICRIDDDKIIIGSELDCKMKIISILRKKIIKEINNEFSCFGICEIESKGIFLTCGDSKNIRIYRNEDYECIKEINDAHEEQINGICKLNDNIFLSYSNDNNIKIWTI
jgi:WD40 repeat protein